MIYDNILETIGNTPLIRLHKVVKDVPAKVYAKVESFNPGNSIKDRIAVTMIDEAENKGLLKPGGTIVEGTSGNTGMGLALVAIQRGYRCIFTTNDKQSAEKINIMKAVGAEVIVCPTDVSADDPRSYYSVAKKLSEEIPNSFYVNQYFNAANPLAHYIGTGPEIWEQTEGKITHLVVGVGTGGTISGTGRYLKEKNPEIKVWGIDTYGSALKKYHETGEFDEKEIYSYITEGIGEDIIPSTIDFSVIDLFEKVTDKDGAVLAREITKKEGIFVGYSCGSALAGLLQLKDKLTKDDIVVVIFHDHGTRYVNKIYSDEWMRERKFLDEGPLTAMGIIERKSKSDFVCVDKNSTLYDTISLMQSNAISQLPVKDGAKICGAISEKTILNMVLGNPKRMNDSVSLYMKEPYPEVKSNTNLKEITNYFNQENDAVVVKDTNNRYHIITSFDLITAIAG